MVRATENLGNKWFLLGRRAIRGILAVEVVRKAMFKGDPGGRPIRINLRKGPSTSVGARAVDEGKGGPLWSPASCSSGSHFGETRPAPHPAGDHKGPPNPSP